MGKKSTFVTQFRRRRQGKTNYKKRSALVKSGAPRLVVRRSNKYVRAQVIEFDEKGDRTIVDVDSRKLEKFGWNASKKNMPAAYLTGLLAGRMAAKKKVEKAILDIGFNAAIHGAFWSAALKGALDAGLKVKAGEGALPSEDRVQGKHIEAFAGTLDEKQLAERFGGYVKGNVDVKGLSKLFASVREKILRGEL